MVGVQNSESRGAQAHDAKGEIASNCACPATQIRQAADRNGCNAQRMNRSDVKAPCELHRPLMPVVATGRFASVSSLTPMAALSKIAALRLSPSQVFPGSSVVERRTVNPLVAGSSPARGAISTSANVRFSPRFRKNTKFSEI